MTNFLKKLLTNQIDNAINQLPQTTDTNQQCGFNINHDYLKSISDLTTLITTNTSADIQLKLYQLTASNVNILENILKRIQQYELSKTNLIKYKYLFGMQTKYTFDDSYVRCQSIQYHDMLEYMHQLQINYSKAQVLTKPANHLAAYNSDRYMQAHHPNMMDNIDLDFQSLSQTEPNLKTEKPKSKTQININDIPLEDYYDIVEDKTNFLNKMHPNGVENQKINPEELFGISDEPKTSIESKYKNLDDGEIQTIMNNYTEKHPLINQRKLRNVLLKNQLSPQIDSQQIIKKLKHQKLIRANPQKGGVYVSVNSFSHKVGKLDNDTKAKLLQYLSTHKYLTKIKLHNLTNLNKKHMQTVINYLIDNQMIKPAAKGGYYPITIQQ